MNLKYILLPLAICIYAPTFAQSKPQPKSAMEYIKQQEEIDPNLKTFKKTAIKLKDSLISEKKKNNFCRKKKSKKPK